MTSEADLRAALRDGAGDGVDADAMIAAGRSARGRRRGALAVAATVVAVGGLAAGLLPRWSSDGGTGAPPAGLDQRGASGAHTYAATAQAPAFGLQSPCTSRLPQVGEAQSRTELDGPLFAEPVVALIACRYGTNGHFESVTTVVNAARAAARLEQGRPAGPETQCLTSYPQYAFYANTATGARLPVVVARDACDQLEVTDGSAVRYLPYDEVVALLP